LSKIRSLLILSLLLLITGVYAKGESPTSSTDSLRIVLTEVPQQDTLQRIHILGLIAKHFFQTEQNDSAINKYLKISALAKATKDYTTLADSYSKLGVLYEYIGAFQTANDYNFKGLRLKEEINAPDSILANSHSNIALNYHELGQFQQAIQHQKLALRYLKETNDSAKIALRYYMLGGLLYETKAYDSARSYYDEAYRIYVKMGEESFISIYHTYIGLIHMKKNQLKRAEQSFLESLKSYPEEGNKRTRVFIYSNLSVVNLIMGAERDSIGEKSLRKSIAYAKKTYEAAAALSFPGQMKKATEVLYKAYKALGNFKSALYYNEQYLALNDSLFAISQQKAIEEVRVQYEADKKDLQIDLLNKENDLKQARLYESQMNARRERNQKLAFSVAFLLSLGILFLIFRLYRQKIKGLKELRLKNELIARQNEEKELLLKEVHHRVKNNLQVISSLLDIQTENIKDDKALSVIEDGQSRIKAMALIHQKLYQNEDLGKIPFQEYAEQLGQQVASIYSISYPITIVGDSIELDIDTAVPLGLILNELLSNAFKYAYSPEGKIELGLQQDAPGEYRLHVKDNGPGLAKDFDFNKASSLGLRLVRRLAKQLYGTASYHFDQGSIFIVTFKSSDLRKKIA
jgi:two-component sensor histidine kinase